MLSPYRMEYNARRFCMCRAQGGAESTDSCGGWRRWPRCARLRDMAWCSRERDSRPAVQARADEASRALLFKLTERSCLHVRASRQLQGGRTHATLNSLSGDWVAVSFALQGERSCFEEIGKRSVWSLSKARSAAAHCKMHTLAVDMDMQIDPNWMQRILVRLRNAVDAGTVDALPLISYDMVRAAQEAFRLLQRGINVGKVVIHIAQEVSSPPINASTIVTGGTGGLGLMTARWQAETGIRTVVLASRSGRISHGSADAQLLNASGANVLINRCDVGAPADVRQLVAAAQSGSLRLRSVWHAAGVLADGTLKQQNAASLAHVMSPKAFGAVALQQSSFGLPLRAYALFSSAAALLGGAGQANYSAANSSLDALSSWRRSVGMAGVSVQWGPWAEVGMASGDAVSARMRASGFGFIGASAGLAVLRAAVLPHGPPIVAMLPVSWRRLLGNTATAPSLLSEFAPRQSDSVAPTAVTTGGPATAALSLEAVSEMVRRTTGNAVDADSPLMEAGLDSLGAVELRNLLQQAVGDGTALPSTLVFDHPTARQITAFLQPSSGATAEPVVASPLSPSAFDGALAPVAMSGIGALLPGGGISVQNAWMIGVCGRDAIGEVPLCRWDVIGLPSSCDALSVERRRHGGFIDGADLFALSAFGVSVSEASAMDPQQRLLLERGYEALHAGGLDRSVLTSSLTGVFIGIASTDYAQVLAASPMGGSVYAATGSSLSIASGRISYILGLHGPCASYDTACSAALVASHAARRALQLGECVSSLASGVNLMLTPAVGTSFAVAGMTSATGRCHTFDERADGYARGEACCAASLRREDEAASLLARGSAVRQDGRSASLTAPNGLAQQGLLRASLEDACMAASDLSCAEAHGTGTALGDPIEAGSLASTVLMPIGGSSSVGLGSGKANVGHAEPAAGATGMLKLALQLQHALIAPNAHLRLLNPHVGFAIGGLSCALSQQAQSSVAGIAGGVSSFGYSGSLVHLVISPVTQSRPSERPCLLPWKRCLFIWTQPAHPFLRSEPAGGSAVASFRTPTTALRPFVADHVVLGQSSSPQLAIWSSLVRRRRLNRFIRSSLYSLLRSRRRSRSYASRFSRTVHSRPRVVRMSYTAPAASSRHQVVTLIRITQ